MVFREYWTSSTDLSLDILCPQVSSFCNLGTPVRHVNTFLFILFYSLCLSLFNNFYLLHIIKEYLYFFAALYINSLVYLLVH